MKFDSGKIIKISASIILCEFAGLIGSVFTTPSIENWYLDLEKPSFNPPNWIFAPVWSLLFLLMGISFYLVFEANWKAKNKIIFIEKIQDSGFRDFLIGFYGKTKAISIFFIQLFLNIFWSFLFFGKHHIGLAFIELIILWIAIALTIVAFYRTSKLAAKLLYPYIFWVSFAGILNLTLWFLN